MAYLNHSQRREGVSDMHIFEHLSSRTTELCQEDYAAGYVGATYNVQVGQGTKTGSNVVFYYDADLNYIGWSYMSEDVDGIGMQADLSVLSGDKRKILILKNAFGKEILRHKTNPLPIYKGIIEQEATGHHVITIDFLPENTLDDCKAYLREYVAEHKCNALWRWQIVQVISGACSEND